MKYRRPRGFFLALFFVVPFLCSHALYAHASGSLMITEIMYDPLGTDTNREWIEVYNGSPASIDLSKDFLLTDGISSTHHTIVSSGASTVPAGSYAVIVQNVAAFQKDYPLYTGILYDSSWTGLTATAGKTVAVIDSNSNVLDQVTYDPTIGMARIQSDNHLLGIKEEFRLNLLLNYPSSNKA